jgi:hypothetical protein
MKKNTRWFALALALGLPAVTLLAQDGNPPPAGERPPRGGGSQPGGRQRPVPPLMAALDLNHDGVIDAEEIAQASASLKKLDKNGDGKLTMDELRPTPPQGQDGAQRGPGGPGGDGPRRRGPKGEGAPEGDRPEKPQRPPAE